MQDYAADPQSKALSFRTGLVGRGILASGSPWLHEHEATALGLELAYDLFDFSAQGWPDERLTTILQEALAAGYSGLNITFPFKQSVIPLLDGLTDDARRIGAVNTIEMSDGRMIGHNTDVTGFAAGLREGLPGARKDVVLQIGCGGAGSATAHALLSPLVGAGRILLFDTNAARCLALVSALAAIHGADRVEMVDDITLAAAQADGIVNATPVGMEKFPGMPIPAKALAARHWVADIVYFPLVTELLANAVLAGCKTLNGSGMVVHQAAEAFEIFVKQTPDRQRMQASFQQFVDK